MSRSQSLEGEVGAGVEVLENVGENLGLDYLRILDGTKVDDDGGEEEDEDGEGEGDQPPTAIGSTASV